MRQHGTSRPSFHRRIRASDVVVPETALPNLPDVPQAYANLVQAILRFQASNQAIDALASAKDDFTVSDWNRLSAEQKGGLFEELTNKLYDHSLRAGILLETQEPLLSLANSPLETAFQQLRTAITGNLRRPLSNAEEQICTRFEQLEPHVTALSDERKKRVRYDFIYLYERQRDMFYRVQRSVRGTQRQSLLNPGPYGF